MILPLLLTAFTSPLIAPPQKGTAADTFPADTLAVVEFSLEPWDRLRKQTVAHDILSDLRILRTFADEAQKEMGISSKSFDFRKILGKTRLFIGVAGKSLPAGSLLLGVDTYDDVSGFDFSTVLDRYEVPYVRLDKSLLAILSPDETMPLAKGEATALLKGFELSAFRASSGGKAKGGGALTLGQQPSWIELHQKLSSENRVFGMWIASEPWLSGKWRHLLSNLQGEMKMDSLDLAAAMASAMDMDQIRGFAWSTEVAPPYILDRAVAMGSGRLMDLYTSYSDSEDEAWERLADCDGNIAMAAVGGMNLEGSGAWIWEIADTMFAELDEFGDVDPSQIKEYLQPLLDVMESAGPGLVSEMSLEQLSDGGQGRSTFSLKDMEKTKSALAEIAPEVMGGIQFGLSQFGAKQIAKWGEGSAIFFDHPSLDGKTRLGDDPTYQTAIPDLRKMAEGQSPLWLAYTSPNLDLHFLENAQDYFQTLSEMFDFPLIIDGSKLANVKELRALIKPGLTVVVRKGDTVLSQSRSTFGLSGTSLMAGIEAAIAEFDRLQVSELDEEEF